MFLPEHYKHELGWGLEDLRFFLERIQTTTFPPSTLPRRFQNWDELWQTQEGSMNRNSWEGVLPDGTVGWLWNRLHFALTGDCLPSRTGWKELKILPSSLKEYKVRGRWKVQRGYGLTSPAHPSQNVDIGIQLERRSGAPPYLGCHG